MPELKAKSAKNQSKYYLGIGRRKSAIARVRIIPGKGQFLINNKEIPEPSPKLLNALVSTGQLGKFDISAIVNGGGFASQEDAISLGIAKAIIEFDESYRPTLRKADLLTRDPREKERKKPGLKRARKAPQWQKR